MKHTLEETEEPVLSKQVKKLKKEHSNADNVKVKNYKKLKEESMDIENDEVIKPEKSKKVSFESKSIQLKKPNKDFLYNNENDTSTLSLNQDGPQDEEGSKNSKTLKNKDKNFKFNSKFGEKKEIKGTFSPTKLVRTEEDKKELRKKQKLLRKTRREKERGYALPDEAKKIFEEIRCNKCPSEKRTELSKDLFMLLSGKISSAVRSHDLARMIQWLIKVGPPDVKEKVINEVIEETVNLCKTKYSNHIILRILQDCDKKCRLRVLSYLIGNIIKLVGNRFGAPVVETYYSKHAKSEEKAYMRQELYSDLFRGGRNSTLTSLADALSQNPTFTSAILKSTKAILSKLINKQSSLGTNLVTDVLYDYLQHCEEQDKLDILEILKSNIQVLVKTKSGNKVLMFLLWESTAKVKKSIVKELKTQVTNIAKSDGNIFIRSLFDSVDDTVLIKKAILPAILDSVEDLVKNTNGRRVILYLVAHRDPAYFHPTELDALKKADESSNVKKDISVKEKELLEPCVDALLVKIKENPEFWFSEPCIAVVTLAVLKKGQGDALREAYQAISELIAKNISENNLKIIEDPGTHMILKKLIKKDTESSDVTLFPEYLVNSLSAEAVVRLVNCSRGCFLLVLLIETDVDIILTRMKTLLKKAKILPKLEIQDSKGAEVLKKVISEKSLL